MNVLMDSLYFTEENIIERKEVSNIPFNSVIRSPENSDVVVIEGNKVRRLKKLDDNVLNPKHTLFGNKYDKSRYVVYFIDKAYQEASWGGNIVYEDFKANEIQEKINIRANFAFKIDRGDRVLSLLSETKRHYNKRYLVEKIRNKIDNAIKQYVFNLLKTKGFVGVQESILELTDKAMDKLNSEVLSAYGIEISNLNLILEEDNIHASKRDKLMWKKYNVIKEEY